MSRLIDADVLKETLLKFNYTTANNQIFRYIDEQPTIEAVPVDRNRIIDEFATKAIERLEELNCEAWRKDILDIAEEMKGGAE